MRSRNLCQDQACHYEQGCVSPQVGTGTNGESKNNLSIFCVPCTELLERAEIVKWVLGLLPMYC